MYSAFDLKDGRYLSMGRNSKSYRECIEAVKSLLALQYSEDLDDLPDKRLLKLFSIRIDKHMKRADNGTDVLLSNIIASYDKMPGSVKSGIKRKSI
jgi:hypothetical protein